MICPTCAEPILIGGNGCACTRAQVRAAIEKDLEQKYEKTKKFIEENPEVIDAAKKTIAYAAQQELLHVMRRISESHFAAEWFVDLEYILWDLVVTGELEDRMMPTEAKHTAAMLAELAKGANGWWVFGSKNQREFIPLKAWLKMYFDRKDAEDGVDANQRTP